MCFGENLDREHFYQARGEHQVQRGKGRECIQRIPVFVSGCIDKPTVLCPTYSVEYVFLFDHPLNSEHVQQITSLGNVKLAFRWHVTCSVFIAATPRARAGGQCRLEPFGGTEIRRSPFAELGWLGVERGCGGVRRALEEQGSRYPFRVNSLWLCCIVFGIRSTSERRK